MGFVPFSTVLVNPSKGKTTASGPCAPSNQKLSPLPETREIWSTVSGMVERLLEEVPRPQNRSVLARVGVDG